ncbi:muconate cycloisomerase family protein [Haloechinothrix sp. YIM 98757]|uniref:Muconate cycloisomerase family protein n=1 Tax=Haloechinothrix aidingensis TaxID=2752311 RepID=A0A837ZZW1_9PSEU|nr:muconate cycloisomerase family protein [Haloechinothrix aidingensis]MBA0124343.1 muconate cycloisomerase family protein [Haloechinothrix aidingensis]
MTRLTIESVETTIVDLPLRRLHRFSAITIDHQSYVLVRLRTAEGVDGLGEGVVPGGPWWGGESVEGIKVVIDTYLAPLLVEREATRVEHLRAVMDTVVAGNPFAKAAVEMALFDAWGKALGVPVYELLGGLYRESIPVTWALGADEAKAAIEEIEAKLESGLHSSFKLKMGAQDPASDVARVLDIARGVAPGTSLRVDLNCAWDELTATRWLPELEAGGIDLVEQPVPGWNTDAMVRLAALLRIPVMADESLWSPHDALTLVRAAGADIFAIKIAKSGGLSTVRRIASIAGAAGIACHGGTTIESTIGTAASAQLYGAIPEVTAGCELFGPLLLADDIAVEEVEYLDGHLRVPQAPGLGISIDERKLRAFSRA